MEISTESSVLPIRPLTHRAESENDKDLQNAEPASNPIPKAGVTSSEESSPGDSCLPGVTASIASSGQDEQSKENFHTALLLVNEGIKQVADGLGQIAAIVTEIRDFVKPGVEDECSKHTSPDSSDGSDDSDDSGTDQGRRDLAKGQYGDESQKKQEEEFFPFPERVVPEFRFCDWEEFKNSYSAESTGYCVEALRAGDVPGREEKAEPLDADIQKDGHTSHDHVDRKDEPWIRKVRIQSSIVLKLLNRLSRKEIGYYYLSRQPYIFERPFRCFIYYQDQMKIELKRLEEAVATSPCRIDQTGETAVPGETQPEVCSAYTSETDGESEDDSTESSGNVDDAQVLQKDIDEVRCYIEFVDTHIVPLNSQFDPSDPSKSQKVRYEDLWYLFKLGDVIYQPPPKSKALPGHGRISDTKQTLWRVYRLQISNDTDFMNGENSSWRQHGLYDTTLWCYYLDFDGVEYGAVTEKFTIMPYPNKQDITKLPFYPLKYAKPAAEILKVAREDGAKFAALIADENKHGTHTGWTLTEDPEGRPVRVNFHGEMTKFSPEHVESDVVFDFSEAYNIHPYWMPEISYDEAYRTMVGSKLDIPHYVKWSDERRSEKLKTYHEHLISSDGISNVEFGHFLEQDQYLGKNDSKRPLSEDDLVLLPKRMFGYALWERKFVLVNVRNVDRKLNDDEENPFNKLQIDTGHKKMIQALISSYLANKKLGDGIRAPMTQDVIRGKGKGVVILLHGVPGVGKTATAEAVAHKWNKPLFPITCGDLGHTAATVEKTLNDIFRFAHLWECVLLLDEADVFITQRSKSDLKRNALVSGTCIHTYDAVPAFTNLF